MVRMGRKLRMVSLAASVSSVKWRQRLLWRVTEERGGAVFEV